MKKVCLLAIPLVMSSCAMQLSSFVAVKKEDRLTTLNEYIATKNSSDTVRTFPSRYTYTLTVKTGIEDGMNNLSGTVNYKDGIYDSRTIEYCYQPDAHYAHLSTKYYTSDKDGEIEDYYLYVSGNSIVEYDLSSTISGGVTTKSPVIYYTEYRNRYQAKVNWEKEITDEVQEMEEAMRNIFDDLFDIIPSYYDEQKEEDSLSVFDVYTREYRPGDIKATYSLYTGSDHVTGILDVSAIANDYLPYFYRGVDREFKETHTIATETIINLSTSVTLIRPQTGDAIKRQGTDIKAS